MLNIESFVTSVCFFFTSIIYKFPPQSDNTFCKVFGFSDKEKAYFLNNIQLELVRRRNCRTGFRIR